NRRDVFDAGDLQTAAVEGANRRLAAGAGATDTDFHVLQAVFLRRNASLLGRHLGGERRALARATKTATTRGRPGQCVALTVGDRDDRVVEGGVDVRNAIQHVLARLLRLLRRLLLGHFYSVPFRQLVTSCRPRRQASRPACAGPCGYAHWCASA